MFKFVEADSAAYDRIYLRKHSVIVHTVNVLVEFICLLGELSGVRAFSALTQCSALEHKSMQGKNNVQDLERFPPVAQNSISRKSKNLY